MKPQLPTCLIALGALGFAAGCAPEDRSTQREPASSTRGMALDGEVPQPNSTVTGCDVLIVGGGTGGVAAAIAAARRGARVCITETTDWLGGQFTAQGLNASDEVSLTDTVGSTAAFRDFRARMRGQYGGTPNPGGCWVSFLCAPPAAALNAYEAMLDPLVRSGKLRIFFEVDPISVSKDGNRITAVGFEDRRGDIFTIEAKQTIDATELGDVLPLSGTAYRTGQEARADTNEQNAPVAACPQCVQAITFVALLEKRPNGEDHTVAPPIGYGVDPWLTGYSHRRTATTSYATFGASSVWEYRRALAVSGQAELSMQNWGDGNDYWWGNIVDASPGEFRRQIAEARDRALGYIYWLQTEVDGTGHPYLKPRGDLLGTNDGIAKYPYIRESRRVRALTTIREEDINACAQGGNKRSKERDDSVGIGWYRWIDLHRTNIYSGGTTGSPRCIGGGTAPGGNTELGTPSQVPYGALVPETTDALLTAAKNIGTTHLSNGEFRMHPFEWTIGEAAGTAAALSVADGAQPRAFFSEEKRLRQLQLRLIADGVPIYWAADVPTADSDWAAIQFAAGTGLVPSTALADAALPWYPNNAALRWETVAAVVRAMKYPLVDPPAGTFSDVIRGTPPYTFVETAVANGLIARGSGRFTPSSPASLGFLRGVVAAALGDGAVCQSLAIGADGTQLTRRVLARGATDVLKQRLGIQ